MIHAQTMEPPNIKENDDFNSEVQEIGYTAPSTETQSSTVASNEEGKPEVQPCSLERHTPSIKWPHESDCYDLDKDCPHPLDKELQIYAPLNLFESNPLG